MKFEISNISDFIFLSYLEAKRRIFKIKYIAEIDITWRCQLSCKHCYYVKSKDLVEKSFADWIAFYNELYHSGIRYILLVGGEPTLRMDLIKSAIEKFEFVDVITNGQIKIPSELNCRIFLSIDGDKTTNDNIRGDKTFDKAIGNYVNDKRVVVNFTLTPYNYKELESVVCLSQSLGWRGVVCNLMTPNINCKSESEILSIGQRKLLTQELHNIKKRYPRVLLISEKAIKWYEQSDHTGSCYWRENVRHFDFQFNKKYCFTELDCRYCGCYAGASLSTKLSF